MSGPVILYMLLIRTSSKEGAAPVYSSKEAQFLHLFFLYFGCSLFFIPHVSELIDTDKNLVVTRR